MKTFYLFIFSLFLVISCKQSIVGNKGVLSKDVNETATTSKFVVDSIKIEDSTTVGKTLKLHFYSKVLLFPSIKNKIVLDSIYKNIRIRLDHYKRNNLETELRKHAQDFFNDNKSDSLEFQSDYEQTWEENLNMNVFSNQNHVLTLSYERDGFSGGAHGYYHVMYKNFDLKNNKTIQLSDIFNDVNKMNWNDILMKYFTDIYQKEILLVEEIPVNRNFFFDDKNITFVYNQYEITAYAAGVVEIPIPFSELKPYLKPEFISRINIK